MAQPETGAPLKGRERRDALRELRSERDAFEAELKTLERRLSFMQAMQSAAEPKDARLAAREVRSGLREAAATVVLGDWHVEETVEQEKVFYRNSYNLDIAKLRVSRLAEAIVWLVQANQRDFHIRDLVLGIVGDLMSGGIHEELVETNGLSPTYAALYARSLLRDLITFLLEHLDIDTIWLLGGHGNHGRTTAKKRIKTGAENSYEHMMLLTLMDEMRNEKRVKWIVPRAEQIYFPIYDCWTRWMHGDEVKYNAGLGGISVPLNRAVYRLKSVQDCRLTCLGHHHTYHPGQASHVNGSLIGYTEYAMSGTFEREDPMQSFFLLDSKRWKCQVTPLWVDGPEEREFWR